MSPSRIALLADGALVLEVEPSVHDAILPWIPRHRAAAVEDSDNRSTVARRAAMLSVTSPHSGDGAEHVSFDGGASTLVLGGVAAYVSANDAWLRGPSGLSGHVDLDRCEAAVHLDPEATPTSEIHGALTLASALLLGRVGRALVHAAAVVDPAGRGWLLVGDSHSGKTTTCATLISAGWRFVADDQVVITEPPTGFVAEGWPREAHLDSGWSSARVTGVRVGADLRDVRDDAWTARAPVHGVCFTRVRADEATALDAMTAADALARLIRQSPWLLADSLAAPAGLALLSRVASLPCAALSLGRDSYANGERLASCFRHLDYFSWRS